MTMLATEDGYRDGGREVTQRRKVERDVVVIIQDNLKRVLELENRRFLHGFCQALDVVLIDGTLTWMWVKLS
jgi:hypothetical protein